MDLVNFKKSISKREMEMKVRETEMKNERLVIKMKVHTGMGMIIGLVWA